MEPDPLIIGQNAANTPKSTTTTAIRDPDKIDAHPVWDALARHLSVKQIRLLGLLLCTVVYILLGFAIYMPGEDWGAGDCIYYAVVVLTTVGYGDYKPLTVGMKVCTIFYVHLALTVVALFAGVITSMVSDLVVAELALSDAGVGLYEKAVLKNKHRRRILAVAVSYILTLVVGTLVFYSMFNNHEEESDSPFVDSLYLTVITITTVGFGDFYPLDDGTKVLGCILMLVGIPICGGAFACINYAVYPDDGGPPVLHKIKNLNMDKFEHVEAVLDELRSAGVGNYRKQGNGTISRFEYLSIILVENGLTDRDTIKSVMNNFEKFDVTHTGFISADDVMSLVAESKKAKESAT